MSRSSTRHRDIPRHSPTLTQSTLLVALAFCALVATGCRTPSTSSVTTTTPAAPDTVKAVGSPRPGAAERDSLAVYLPPWSFMSLGTAGVDTFLLRHPSYDGRGVVILIFDTGVDMSIAGLERTPDGRRKVIDAIDFSSSNVIQYRKAKLGSPGTGPGAGTATADGLALKLRGIRELKPPPASDADVFIGVMDEERYRNSSVRDFDGDGDAASRFGAILYRAADGWRVALDTDGDSSMAAEQGIGNYRDSFETLQLRQRGGGKSPLTFAASIDPVAHSVSFHYDMGGHGTHVAGIASGYGINGEAGFNGVAPGAEIISCKFSGDTVNDNTVTGSMRRAYEYAARLADSLDAFNRPVVVNMSFGIGSAEEGRADIERFLDTLIPNHPNLYVVTSSGNEGPGLSTVGIPSSAARVITVGAALPKAIGRDGYGAALDRDILWDFSSRGGEVDKPDVIAPGTAVSTVPRYAHQSRESGTSMASPYTAGVVALLLSAMRQEDSAWRPTQELMRRALRYSARPLIGYPDVEQGGGMIDVRRAYELLRSYRRSGFAQDIELYTISTTSPNYSDGRGPTAFWRSAFVPDEDWRQAFTVARYIPRHKRADADFFRAYTLESTAPWLRTVQNTVYIRNRDVATIEATYDRSQMREPGIYCGRIIARRASGAGPAPDGEREFELLNTVIVPYTFSPEKEYAVTAPAARLAPGMTQRFYFAPPAGAAAITFTLSVPKGSRSNVSGKIADRRGVTENYLARTQGRDRNESSNTISMSALGDGVIEVVIQADAFESGGGVESEFTLSARCLMLEMQPTVRRSGSGPELLATIVNRGTAPVRGEINYTIKGYGRTITDTMRSDSYVRPVVLRRGDGALWLQAKFSDEAYMRATDVLVQIVDGEGNVQAQEPLNTPSVWLFLPNFNREADSTKLFMQVVFGAAHHEKAASIPIEITENHMRPSESRSLSGFTGNDIYPLVPETFSARILDTIKAPAGYHQIGEVTFRPRGSEQSIPFEFTFE